MKKTKFMMYVVILLIISTTLSAFADAPIQTDELKQQIKAALKEGNEDLQEELCKLDYSNVIQETKQFNVLIDETKQVEAHKELFGVQYELADNWNIFYENNGKFRTSKRL